MKKFTATCCLFMVLMAFAVQQSESTVLLKTAVLGGLLKKALSHKKVPLYHRPAPVEKKVVVVPEPVKKVVVVPEPYKPDLSKHAAVVKHVVDTGVNLIDTAVDAVTGKVAHVAGTAHQIGQHARAVAKSKAAHVHATVDHLLSG